MRALTNAHLWQPGSNLRAWLVTIMRNQYLATMARARLWGAAPETIDIADHRSCADVESRLTLRDVERAYRRLPAKQRSAVLHAGIEGRSYSEVAGLMGLSVDAVRCHLARGRDQLRSTVYQRDESTWIRPAIERPSAVPVAVPAGSMAARAGALVELVQ